MDNLRKGIEVVTKATQEDQNHNYGEAIRLYREALKLLELALQTENNPQTKQTISEKIKEYSARITQVEAIQLETLGRQQMMSAPPSIDWTSLQQKEKEKWKAEESSSGKIFTALETAMKKIEQAVDYENSRQYSEALDAYQAALESFLKAMEEEKNPDIKQAIRDKVSEYMTRAELIKGFLEEKNRKSSIKLQVSETASIYVQAAIEAANAATEFDQTTKIPEAIEKYQVSIDNFTLALKYETNESIKSMMRERIVAYTMRIEQLRQIQSSGGTVPTPIPFGIKPGEKYKPPPISKKSSGKKTWH